MLATQRSREWLVIAIGAIGFALAFVLPALRQSQQYHQFADARAFLGVPNFWNVVSNAPFVLVGLWGLWWLAAHLPSGVADLPSATGHLPSGVADSPSATGHLPSGVADLPSAIGHLPSGVADLPSAIGHLPSAPPRLLQPDSPESEGADVGASSRPLLREECPAGEWWAYLVSFIGIILTGAGSAFYHWRPTDSTLVWDRLPMTVAFMSLLSATIAERTRSRAGLAWLGPLLGLGIGSVVYWRLTGNLWPYGAAQYLSLLLLGLMLVLFPSRYTRGSDMVVVMLLYALAKVAEALDGSLYSLTHLLSGHTLKHLLAATAIAWLLRMLMTRSPR